VISRLCLSLQGQIQSACYDCNPILVSSGDVSTDCEPRLVKHAFGF
jgi:hypothetical protein